MEENLKQLLLKDLCSRLPYGVILLSSNRKVTYQTDGNTAAELLVEEGWKPYLRSMSSMTEEERMEFESLNWRVDELDFNNPWTPNGEIENVLKGINWLNAHHFDFCNLIERGLAIAVTEENNPYKE